MSKKPDPESVGFRLRELRQKAGVTQPDLAAVLGGDADRSGISHYERGARDAPREVLEQFAEFFAEHFAEPAWPPAIILSHLMYGFDLPGKGVAPSADNLIQDVDALDVLWILGRIKDKDKRTSWIKIGRVLMGGEGGEFKRPEPITPRADFRDYSTDTAIASERGEPSTNDSELTE